MSHEIQLKRLKRHYEHSVQTHDHISFLDLATVLRVWTEISNELSEQAEHKRNFFFKTASAHKNVKRISKDSPYVLSYFGTGTKTYAHNGNIANGPGMEPGKPMSVGASLKMNSDDGALELRSFYYVGLVIAENKMRFLNSPSVKKNTIYGWMGSEVVRSQFLNNDGELISASIPRNTLIKRVANTLDATHNSGGTKRDKENKFDPHIDFLLKHNVGAIPLPFFILLNTAQEIISYFNHLSRA
ncbi:hypothetical protein MLD52_12715 [Puniceicoccaceae bacterium K14]|nr:hypothetical protein [Puniceicoccaceae bacterium K14]